MPRELHAGLMPSSLFYFSCSTLESMNPGKSGRGLVEIAGVERDEDYRLRTYCFNVVKRQNLRD